MSKNRHLLVGVFIGTFGAASAGSLMLSGGCTGESLSEWTYPSMATVNRLAGEESNERKEYATEATTQREAFHTNLSQQMTSEHTTQTPEHAEALAATQAQAAIIAQQIKDAAALSIQQIRDAAAAKQAEIGNQNAPNNIGAGLGGLGGESDILQWLLGAMGLGWLLPFFQVNSLDKKLRTEASSGRDIPADGEAAVVKSKNGTGAGTGAGATVANT